MRIITHIVNVVTFLIVLSTSIVSLAQDNQEILLPQNAGRAEIEALFAKSELQEAENFQSNAYKLPAGIAPTPAKPGQSQPVPTQPTQIQMVQAIGVPGIQFASSSATLTDKGQEIVDIIADILSRNNSRVTVVGHTDSYGDPSYNLELSQKRALTVAYYLVHIKGINPNRINYAGMGSRQPIDPYNPEASINRRVTFVIETPA